MTSLVNPRIYAQGPSDPPTGKVARDRNRAARTALWHRMGVVAIDPEDLASEWEQQFLRNLAERLYGRRKA
jgi:hypothetical protein